MNQKLRLFISIFVTAAIFLLAIWLGRSLWVDYMEQPWTRNGRVRADIINVAADVSGRVVEVPVKDNQRVKKGDLLMKIDPEGYQLAVKQADALVAARKAALAMRLANARRRAAMDSEVVSRESIEDTHNMAGVAAAEYDQALASLAAARLNLERTEVRAAVDGYVTNLNVHVGDYAQASVGKMAIVADDSWWVYGYFEETKLSSIRVGDPVDLELMSGQRLQGHVESIARAIYDRDNPASRELVADVNPTFNWVRLAQRVPVRIRIDRIPDGAQLAAGITVTVIVRPQAAP